MQWTWCRHKLSSPGGPAKSCFAFLTCCLAKILPWKPSGAAEQCEGTQLIMCTKCRECLMCRREPERRGSLPADAANTKLVIRWKCAFLERLFLHLVFCTFPHQWVQGWALCWAFQQNCWEADSKKYCVQAVSLILPALGSGAQPRGTQPPGASQAHSGAQPH